MAIEEKIPSMTDAELTTLRANAARLADNEGPRRTAAGLLLPVIDAEIAARKAAKPAPAPRAKAPAKAKAAPKAAKPKKKAV